MLVVTRLMVAFARGDRSAFGPLFRVLWPIVLHYCSRSLSCPSEAEDAAQEAIVKVFSRIGDFDCERDGLAWVLGIAFYEVLTFRRRHYRSREHLSDDLEWLQDDAMLFDQRMMIEEDRAVFDEAVAALRPEDQAIVRAILSDAEPLSRRAGTSARKRKQRALERLRSAWHRLQE